MSQAGTTRPDADRVLRDEAGQGHVIPEAGRCRDPVTQNMGDVRSGLPRSPETGRQWGEAVAAASRGVARRQQAEALAVIADVLVIGGGPAGAWAAIHAARQGASVVLVDKGFCGTSGATAAAGTNVWHVPAEAREAAKNSRFAMGGFLAEPEWMDRVLQQTWESCAELAAWGYPFPVDDSGQMHCVSLQGADYMRLMRRQAKEAGVRILDHSPALSLLQDAAGAVAGASGVQRQRHRDWEVQANAVVIASGGCAFLSRALGCNVLTGDGYLMAAEAGAELSGMELSNAYGLGPAFSSVTKSLFYNWATFYDGQGRQIEGAGSSRGRGIIARTLRTEPVYACLDRADEQVRAWMRKTQHNFFLPFIRRGSFYPTFSRDVTPGRHGAGYGRHPRDQRRLRHLGARFVRRG